MLVCFFLAFSLDQHPRRLSQRVRAEHVTHDALFERFPCCRKHVVRLVPHSGLPGVNVWCVGQDGRAKRWSIACQLRVTQQAKA